MKLWTHKSRNVESETHQLPNPGNKFGVAKMHPTINYCRLFFYVICGLQPGKHMVRDLAKHVNYRIMFLFPPVCEVNNKWSKNQQVWFLI